MKILIVGAGNMGKTYAKSLLSNYFTQPASLFLLDKQRVSDPYLKEVPLENIATVATSTISQADIVLLAVKPQDFDALAPTLVPFLHSDQLLLSIMAGVTMQTISTRLQLPKIVRAMPNLPAQIGMGMTVFSCTAAVDKKELFIIQNLLNATGKSIYVEDENLLNAATAISGSGPAYVYYFMQAMIEKAEQMGFHKSAAELLVNQTFMGAVHLHNQYDFTCKEWIDRVASKGGTTEAALHTFDHNQLAAGISEGLQSALERAIVLGHIQ